MPIIGIIASSGKKSPIVDGAVAWFDADDATTFTYSSGSLVSQWNDKSGTGNHFTQSTVGYQPTRTTNLQNGRAGVEFNVDSMNFTANYFYGAHTLQMVLKQTTVSGYEGIIGTDKNGGFSYGIDPAPVYSIFCTQVADDDWTTAPGTTNADLMSFDSDGRVSSTFTCNGWKNGTLMGSNPASLSGYTDLSAQPTGIGSNGDSPTNEPFLGYVCEIILYNFILTQSQREANEAYLKTKWGTP